MPRLPLLLLSLFFGSPSLEIHAQEVNDDNGANGGTNNDYPLTIPTSFLVNKLRGDDYTDNDMIHIEEAFKSFMIDLEASWKGNPEEGDDPNLQGTLDPNSIVVSNTTICPEYLSRFKFCRQVETKYEVNLNTKENVEVVISNANENEDILTTIERYANATRSAIDDGLLQESLSAIHPDSHIFIIGDGAATVLAFLEESAGEAHSNFLSVDNSFNVVTSNGLNENDLQIVRESILLVVESLLSDFDSFSGDLVVVDFSADVDDSVPCRYTSFTSRNTSCEAIFYRYDLFVTDSVAAKDIREMYTNATQDAVFDGTLGKIITEMKPSTEITLIERQPTPAPREVTYTRSPTIEPTTSNVTASQPQKDPWYIEYRLIFIIIGAVLGALIMLAALFCLLRTFCFPPPDH